MTTRVLSLLIVLVPTVLRAQEPGLEQRVSDHIGRMSLAGLWSATRYVPVVNLRGLSPWSAPVVMVELQGLPFDAFPLNLVSPDYVPFDLIVADEIRVEAAPVASASGTWSAGRIRLHSRPIADSLVVAGRVYGGSETGDVILDEYTKDNLPFFNKNKIGFSGAASLSGQLGSLACRVTAAGFNYYSVGYEDRDRIILSYIDLPTFSRPNRHYIGVGEVRWNGTGGTEAALYAGINAFHAWEYVPFASTFTVLSGSLGTVRLTASRIAPFLEAGIRRDMVSVSMRDQRGTMGGSYNGSVTALHARPFVSVGPLVQIAAPFEYRVSETVAPSDNDQLFTGGERRTSWTAGLEFLMKSEGWGLRLTGRSEQVDGSAIVSGTLDLTRAMSARGRIRLTLTSVGRSPSFLERSGVFRTVRQRPALASTDTFLVRGNPLLEPSRTTGGEISYAGGNDSRPTVSVFFYSIEREIRRRPGAIIRSAVPGDVVFSGMMENHARRTVAGIEVARKWRVSERLALELRYGWTQGPAEVPRHQVRVAASARVTELTRATLALLGTSRTRWDEFVVPPSGDDRLGVGSDGVVAESWMLNATVFQQLGSVWFLRDLEARLDLQNLLNRGIRTTPFGVPYDFAVIGFLAFRL